MCRCSSIIKFQPVNFRMINLHSRKLLSHRVKLNYLHISRIMNVFRKYLSCCFGAEQKEEEEEKKKSPAEELFRTFEDWIKKWHSLLEEVLTIAHAMRMLEGPSPWNTTASPMLRKDILEQMVRLEKKLRRKEVTHFSTNHILPSDDIDARLLLYAICVVHLTVEKTQGLLQEMIFRAIRTKEKTTIESLDRMIGQIEQAAKMLDASHENLMIELRTRMTELDASHSEEMMSDFRSRMSDSMTRKKRFPFVRRVKKEKKRYIGNDKVPYTRLSEMSFSETFFIDE